MQVQIQKMHQKAAVVVLKRYQTLAPPHLICKGLQHNGKRIVVHPQCNSDDPVQMKAVDFNMIPLTVTDLKKQSVLQAACHREAGRTNR